LFHEGKFLPNLKINLSMDADKLENYIGQKLAELDQQKDMQDVIHKGKLSFGMDSSAYSQLPVWQGLVKQKKLLVKLFWLDAVFLSLMAAFFAGNFFEGAINMWWKEILRLLINAAIVFVFAVAGMYFSLFTKFRKTEREVRKLIYQDILAQLKKSKEAVV
jgi:hypothetical protein